VVPKLAVQVVKGGIACRGFTPAIGCHGLSLRCDGHQSGNRVPRTELPEANYAMQAGHLEVQHAEALRSLGDLSAARDYAERVTAIAADSHVRGQIHRFATLAMILAGQGKADAATDVAFRMLDLKDL
jgi:hypothetical protein